MWLINNILFDHFRTFPEYYEMIEEPIDLTRMNMRLKSGDYNTSLNKFTEDFNLFVENTVYYYTEKVSAV